MTWIAYNSLDEQSQTFIAVILIIAISAVAIMNLYFFVKEKLS